MFVSTGYWKQNNEKKSEYKASNGSCHQLQLAESTKRGALLWIHTKQVGNISDGFRHSLCLSLLFYHNSPLKKMMFHKVMVHSLLQVFWWKVASAFILNAHIANQLYFLAVEFEKEIQQEWFNGSKPS